MVCLFKTCINRNIFYFIGVYNIDLSEEPSWITTHTLVWDLICPTKKLNYQNDNKYPVLSCSSVRSVGRELALLG